MTTVRGPWQTAAGVQRLFQVFEDGGHNLFFVGGCVRNALLGREVTDIDLATDATPEAVTDLAQKAGGRAIPTGLSHGLPQA